MFYEILSSKHLTIKDISKGTGIPRSTISDLVHMKTSIENMSAGNLYKLSHFLNIDMQDLYEYCKLPAITDPHVFIEGENTKIVTDGLKAYVRLLAEKNLVETTYALNDQVRFQKYMSAIRDFHKYRKLELPQRYCDYIAYLED